MEKVQVLSLRPIAHTNAQDRCDPQKKRNQEYQQKDNQPTENNGGLLWSHNEQDIKQGARSELEFSNGKNLNTRNYRPSDSATQEVKQFFGRSHYRASYNDIYRTGPIGVEQHSLKKVKQPISKSSYKQIDNGLYLSKPISRSNSSLNLEKDHKEKNGESFQPLRREYGSHGSINVKANSNEQLSESPRFGGFQNFSASDSDQNDGLDHLQSRGRFQKLWVKDSSLFKKLRQNKNSDKGETVMSESSAVIGNANAKSSDSDIVLKMDDNPGKSCKRTALAHYDCTSLAANLSVEHLKSVLADRSNTTTGASAASISDNSSQIAALQNGSEQLNVKFPRPNEDKSNSLLKCCPFFVNEIGGDGERIVSLSREINKSIIARAPASQLYRSPYASSIGLLEPVAGRSHWSQSLCPYVNRSPTVEAIDQGSAFYATYFKNQEHQNWFGVDENLGAVALSIKREKQEESTFEKAHGIPSYQYRVVIRTAELFNYQGTLKEEIVSQRSDKISKGLPIKEIVEYLCPQINLSCLRLGTSVPETEEALIKVDELGLHTKFKVGVLYCRAGQKTEEEMYNNENAGPAFSEFLEILGQRVRLKNFEKYRGGLDKKTDSTGHYSVYAEYHGCEVMFHVSTLLPYTENNRKQLLRKRHIGNDIVTIIFQEPGAQPFSPKFIRSHFQHVFIVVQAINPCTDKTMYTVAVTRFQDVPMFGPPIPEGATFPKSKKFSHFLLAKVINGELAALRSDKFSCMAARTKHEYLKELTVNHCTATTLETSSKFSLMGFARSSRKEKNRFKFMIDNTARGAISWNIAVEDATLQVDVNGILAISMDSLVVVEESTGSVIFAVPAKSILGWALKPSEGIHLFYHQGECLSIVLRTSTPNAERDDILTEIATRLTAVTQGAPAQEILLKRNSSGLLGFNVQQDGIITEVENFGMAAKAGLHQGSRIVEICKVTLATLCQEQMVDLLKTSMTVSVTIIPPHIDGSPRRGCNIPTCTFLLGGAEGDYENLTPPEKVYNTSSRTSRKHPKRSDRNFSPPQSATSSGYGTGSSSHSFNLDATKSVNIVQESEEEKVEPIRTPDYTGTISSTSSAHSSDRFSELYNDDYAHSKPVCDMSSQTRLLLSHDEVGSQPPPLPVRAYTKKDIVAKGHRNFPQNLKGPHDPKSSLQFDNTWKSLHSGQPIASSLEQDNYAVPPHVRPVSQEILNRVIRNPDMSGNDCESSGSFPDVSNIRYSQRRNSSPQSCGAQLRVEMPVDQNLPYCTSTIKASAHHNMPKSRITEEELVFSKSEDDLSCSNRSSPRLEHRAPSSASNSSPCLSSQAHSPSLNCGAIAKLKQATNPSKAHRSSGLASSTLQQELMRLINPDYLSDSESMSVEFKGKSKGSSSTNEPNKTSPSQILEQRGSSKSEGNYESIGETEFINRKNVFARGTEDISRQSVRIKEDNYASITSSGDTEILKAKPATVIDNTKKTAAHEDSMKSIDHAGVQRLQEYLKLSLHDYTKNYPNPPNLDEEWNSLVHTASQAIGCEQQDRNTTNMATVKDLNANLRSLNFQNEMPPISLGNDMPSVQEQPSIDDAVNSNPMTSGMPRSLDSNLPPYPPNPPIDAPFNLEANDSNSLLQRLEFLEKHLAAEKKKSGKLEHQLSLLRTENSKLQADSRAAAHQLHRFTDWFFKNIQK